ncbi:MAG: AEC family transporter [Synechococcales cyanobacterium]
MLPLLLKIYTPLVGWTLLGVAMARFFPAWVQQGSRWIGPFLFWVGVPLSIVGFLRQTPLDGGVWLAAVVAHGSYGLAWGLGWLWLRWQTQGWSIPWTRGRTASFQLAAMLGNTGYIGYPICIAVGGTEFFAWALFFDMLGTLFGAYGLGTWVAASHRAVDPVLSQAPPMTAFVTEAPLPRSVWDPWIQVSRSPAIWGFVVGMWGKTWILPELAERSLIAFAWGMIPLTLVLLGMRMGAMRVWGLWRATGAALGIRLVLVPLVVGLVLTLVPIPAMARLMLVLQSGMPPAMATLVLTETYQLDRQLTVTALALGFLGILLTVPLWLWLWGSGLEFAS